MGGSGNYGGGGGGGGGVVGDVTGSGNGADGGFGGGGGASGPVPGITSTSGGKGGFGGGGGSGAGSRLQIDPADPGRGGPFGGNGGGCAGGGGGALGGAIFNDGGMVVIRNSTLTGSSVFRGVGAPDDALGGNHHDADNGVDAGAAIFSRNGSLILLNATISGNSASGSDIQAGGGIVVMNDGSGGASFTLDNTILAGNGSSDCLLKNSVGVKGAGNLILSKRRLPGRRQHPRSKSW